MQESKGWQGDPQLVQYRQRLISSFVISCRQNKIDFIKISDDSLKQRDWYRTSGEIVCNLCGLTYKDHPHFPYSYDTSTFNADTELCNGDLVKL